MKTFVTAVVVAHDAPDYLAVTLQALDAQTMRVASRLSVKVRALAAHLTHVAEHQQTGAGQVPQHLAGGTY